MTVWLYILVIDTVYTVFCIVKRNFDIHLPLSYVLYDLLCSLGDKWSSQRWHDKTDDETQCPMMPYSVSLLAVSMYEILYAIAFGQPCVFKRHSSCLTVSFNPCRTRKCMVDPSFHYLAVYTRKPLVNGCFIELEAKKLALLSRTKSCQTKNEWINSACKWSQIYLKCTSNGPQMYPIKFHREQDVQFTSMKAIYASVCWIWMISSKRLPAFRGLYAIVLVASQRQTSIEGGSGKTCWRKRFPMVYVAKLMK